MTNSELLSLLVDRRQESPPYVVCCVGYQYKKGRVKKLVKFILDRIPEFVLTEEEIAMLDPLRPFSTIEKALPFFTDVENPSSGGEVGELLTHMICQNYFGTTQLVKRLSYKMRSRDAVTGFDVAHYSILPSGKLELWLGEAKFYSSRSSAISAAIASLSDHLLEGILTERKALMGPKLSRKDPNYEYLTWIFHEDTRLEEIVDRLVVPVMIACDTKADISGEQHCDYMKNVGSEVSSIIRRITEKFGCEMDFVFIYVPLNDKKSFDGMFNLRLSALA